MNHRRKYLLKKDTVDERDLTHNFKISRCHNDIKKIDLRPYCPDVYDQLSLGSCTANSIAGVYEFDEIKEKEKNIFTPSRLFIYYNEREIEHTVNDDSGASLRDGMKSINKTGVCPEDLWKYDVDNFSVKPPPELYELSKKHLGIEYKRLDHTKTQLRQCLIDGFPFVFGLQIFSSFESDLTEKTGIVQFPNIELEECLGGHALMCVGFNDDNEVFIVRNSWGKNWGNDGYCEIPYKYILDKKFASDFWTLTRVIDNN